MRGGLSRNANSARPITMHTVSSVPQSTVGQKHKHSSHLLAKSRSTSRSGRKKLQSLQSGSASNRLKHKNNRTQQLMNNTGDSNDL